MNSGGALGIRGFGFVAAPAGTRLPEDLDPLYQPFLGKRIRKVGRYIKLSVAGATAAVARSGIRELPPERTGVFLGSGLGNLPDVVAFTENVFDQEGLPASPTQFANSVANAGAFYVAQSLGLVGPVLALGQDELSFECALLNAQAMLAADGLDYALVGGIDVYWPDDAAQRQRMGYEHDAPVAPGEGSGWLLLERLSSDSIATLEEVSVLHPDDGRTVGQHIVRYGAPALVAAGTRLEGGGLQAGLPDGVEAIPSGFGSFLSESAVLACILLMEAQARGLPLHTLSQTRDGMVGIVTMRSGQPGETGT